jgi:DNA repair exonuclease SbcCD ATPase subunit
MPEALPDFQLASELGPSPSREEELEGMVRNLTNELEELRSSGTEPQPGQKCPPAMKPEERQALLQVLSDLGEKNKELEARILTLEKSIIDIKNVNDQTNERIRKVKSLAKDSIGELHNEIVDIQDNKTVDKETVNDMRKDLDEALGLIDQHAEAINKVWKATRKAPSPTGKKTLARIEKLKEILRRGPKTYKELERLLGISPKEMNRLVSRLDSRSYEIFYRAGDDRQKVLRLRAWNAHPTNGAEQ